jgi:hypothetical protein
VDTPSLRRVLIWAFLPSLFGLRTWGGVQPLSNFLTLDGFKAKENLVSGESRFQGYGGYEIFLGVREGLSRLDLRFGSRRVPLFVSGAAFGYGEESWLANKPLEWRGLKAKGGFEPYALIFRSFRPNPGGGRPIETYVVVRLEGCDSRVIGAFSTVEGPLEAVRLADQEGGEAGGKRPLFASQRLGIERTVMEWLVAVRGGDEKRLAQVYSSGFLRTAGRRGAKREGVPKAVASFGGGEAVNFSITESGGKLAVAFSLFREVETGAERERLIVTLGMLMEGGRWRVSSESVGEGGTPKEGAPNGASREATAKVTDAATSESDLVGLMRGRWLASDGKGMMTLAFEDEGRLVIKRLGALGKGNSATASAWSVKGDVVLVDLGKGEEERRLVPVKGGKFKFQGSGGLLFLEKQR